MPAIKLTQVHVEAPPGSRQVHVEAPQGSRKVSSTPTWMKALVSGEEEEEESLLTHSIVSLESRSLAGGGGERGGEGGGRGGGTAGGGKGERKRDGKLEHVKLRWFGASKRRGPVSGGGGGVDHDNGAVGAVHYDVDRCGREGDKEERGGFNQGLTNRQSKEGKEVADLRGIGGKGGGGGGLEIANGVTKGRASEKGAACGGKVILIIKYNFDNLYH